MNINELPTELIMKIFGYLSSCEKLLLVNYRFYNIICEMNDKNISLCLDSRLLGDHLNLLSVERTSRKVSKLEIDFWRLNDEDMPKVISVIRKFSLIVKYLKMESRGGRDIPALYLLKILSLVPNLENLDCKGVLVEYQTTKTISIEELNLKHLKFLKIMNCNDDFAEILKKLPPTVLTELHLAGGLPHLNTLLRQQPNVKNLTINISRRDDSMAFRFINSLTLESLQLSGLIFTKALSKQTTLKSLSLSSVYPGTLPLMQVAANSLTRLEKLDWEYGKSLEDFVYIKNLKNLKHLTLRGVPFVNAITTLDNSHIVTFEMGRCSSLSNQQISALAASLPNLKVLKAANGTKFKWERVTSILKHFNFVEGLKLWVDFDGEIDDYLKQSDTSNVHLTELEINVEEGNQLQILTKMIADYPNMKNLKLRLNTGNESTQLTQFQLILDGFKNLQSLTLCRSYDWQKEPMQLTIDDFKYLRNHKKGLQLLSVRLSENFIVQHLEELRAMFAEVKLDRYNFSSNKSQIAKIKI